MAIPRVNNAQLILADTVRLEFDSPLDTAQLSTPLTQFRINYGEDLVTAFSYSDNRYLDLTIDATYTWQSKLNISYTPPSDILLALRGSIDNNLESNVTEIRKVAVRSFSAPVLNRLQPPDEGPKNLSTEYPHATAELRNASVDDFILAFGRSEAVQLSNIDDPSRDEVNYSRIQMAIEDANSLIDSYVKLAPKAGKLLVSANRRRTSLVIARFYLDSVRRREDVSQDYERAIKELQASLDANTDLVPDDQLARNSAKGLLRVWRIPQRYNSISGKGLSGWWTDSASEFNSDYRKDYVDQELNNDEPNGGTPSEVSRPNDLGGIDNP